MNLRLTCLAALSALLLAACGDSKEPTASAPTATATAEATATPTPYIEKVTGDPTPMPEVTPSGKDEPKVSKPSGKANELITRDLEVGDGDEIAVGKLAAVDYKGWLFANGDVFDSTWGKGGKPVQFIFGAGQVIKGWDEGLKGMKVGGRRELIVPSELAYGDHGQASIPPNAPIVFVVDLLAVN
jgi:FKBP-type peptidyl-prolyl cis-trans isomerase